MADDRTRISARPHPTSSSAFAQSSDDATRMRPAATPTATSRWSPSADLVLDAVALLLLLGSVVLPWDWQHRTYAVWYADVAVLLAVVALTLPWLLPRLPDNAVPGTILTKRLLAAPMAVCTLVNLVIDLLAYPDQHALRFGVDAIWWGTPGQHWDGGTGTGVAVALLGTVLAVVPRSAERCPESSRSRWDLVSGFVIVTGAALAMVGGLLALARSGAWSESPYLDSAGVLLRLVPVLTTAALLTAVLVPVVSLFRGRAEGRVVLLCLAGTYAALSLLLAWGDGDRMLIRVPGVEMLDMGSLGTPVLFAGLGLSAAALGGWPAHPRARGGYTARQWLAVVRLATQIGAIVSAIQLLQLVCYHLGLDSGATGRFWPQLLLYLLLTGLTVTAAALARAPRPKRLPVLALLGGTTLLALVSLLLTNVAQGSYSMLWPVFAGWTTLPALSVYALTRPSAVRGELGPLRSS